MAPDSPTRLVRNKSTSFGDFFRGSSSSSSRAAGSRNSQIPSSPTLPPPIPESNASPKKSAGRIPFLRSRRKSTHSTASGISQSYASESENEAALPGPSTRPRSGVDSSLLDPAPSYLSPSTSTPSFGSILAAHLTPSKSKIPDRARLKSSKSTEGRTGTPVQNLVPPVPRKHSPTTSLSSNASRQSGATTPRPTIRVSTPEEQFDDLFTRPDRKSIGSLPSLPPSSINEPSSSAGRTTPTTAFSTFTVQPQRAHAPQKAIKSGTALRSFQDTNSVTTPARNVSVEKRRGPGFRPKEKPVPIESLAQFPEAKSPPNIPLPEPPREPDDAASLSSASLPRMSPTLSRRSFATLSSGPPSPRLRTQSLASVLSPPSSPPPTPPPIRSHSRMSSRGKRSLEESRNKENRVADYGTEEQLKSALKAQTQQVDHLTVELRMLKEEHAAEKTALEKRVATLEREVARKDIEIKGLTWLVVNERPGSSGHTPSGSVSDHATKSTPSLLESTSQERSMERTPLNASLRRKLNLTADDSGSESYSQTSEVESSMPGSGSESQASSTAKRLKLRKADLKSNLSHIASLRQLGNGSLTVAGSNSHLARSSKRSSVASTVSTASSSAIQPTTPTSSLSAIPEMPPPVPPKPRSTLPKPSVTKSSTRDPAIAAALLGVEKARAKEASQKAQRPLPTAPKVPSPAAAYAANLKRSRPPSIAQVLDYSSISTPMSSPARITGNPVIATPP